jgi:hypothetical protein
MSTENQPADQGTGDAKAERLAQPGPANAGTPAVKECCTTAV